MECVINGVSFEGCNSNKNVIFVDSYKEVFFDILSLELNEQTIIAELIENTKTGPYVNIKKVILNGKAYQDIKFLIIKEKADTRIHLNETKLNESAAGIDYIQPKLTPAIRVNTPVVAPNSKPVDVSARQEIERIKEQALSNIRVEKEKLLLLKEEINSANISIDGKVEEYRSELLKSFYDIADSNKNVLEKKIDIALKDATSQLQEINSTNYINHVNDIVKKHVDDIAAQYSGKEKDLLESINDKVTVDISEIANVLEGKVNLAIKTIAEDNTVTIQDKNNQILEHVNKEITNATESLNITLENYKTHLLDNYLQTLKNSSDEFKKSTNVTVNEAVTDLQEKNQTAFNLQSNNSITKSVNDLTKIIESSKLEFGQEMRTSLREVTDDASTKILNSFNLEKIKIDEKIEHLNAEAVDIFNNLKHNTKVSLESKIEAIDSNINSLNDTKNKFIDEVTILIEQFKTKTLQSIEAEKLIIDEKIKKLDTISKNTEDTISKLSEQVTANKEKLVDEVDTYLHEVAIANKNTVAEKIEELQKKINESLLEVNIETVYSKFIDVYGNKVDVAITEFIDSKKRLIKEELNDIGVPQPTQDFDTLIKSHWEQKEPEMMQKVKKIAATYADSYGGGGSVAVQYAKGGTMDGNLNITGMILSGGQDLSSIFSSGGGGGGNPAVDTLVTTTSADWNQSYTYFTWLTANSGSTSTVDLSNIAAVSANWNASYTNLVGNSGAYLSGVNLSDISAVSANWNTSYTFLTSNSALILGDITNIASVSANWDNAWTNLIYNSGAYLSAVDLSNIASVSANWNTSYTFLTSNSALILGDLTNIANTSATWNNAWTNLIYNSGAYLSAVDLSNIAAVSANWNNTYTQFNSNSALYATTSYVNSNFLSLSGGTLSGTLTLYKDLSVLGNLFVTGSATFGNTIITTTSALSVVNTGPGPALYISQGPGGGDIASFYDSTNNLEVLHIGNDTPWINNKGIIGIRTSNPNETLTVIGGISATGIISTSATNSNSNNWTSSFTYANANSANLTSSTSSYLPLSGGTLTGGLTGTTGASFATSSGSVGIGTASPARLLSLNAGASTTYLQLCNNNTGLTSGNGLELIMDQAGLNAAITNRENGYLALETNGTERGRFTSAGLAITGALSSTTGANFATSSGNVGIGETSPQQKLAVLGKIASITTTGDPYGAWLDGTSANSFLGLGPWYSQAGYVKWEDSGTRRLTIYTYNTANHVTLQEAGGTVGIGTATPTAKLNVKDNSATTPTLLIQNDALTTGKLARFYSNNGNPTHSGNMVEIDNDFNAGGTADLLYLNQADDGDGIVINMQRGGVGITVDGVGGGYSAIFNNGNVGIGTASPTRALNISKSGAAFPSTSNPVIRLDETSSGRFAIFELDSSTNLNIWNSDAGAGSIKFLRGTGSGTESMRIDSSGNVGIGTTSPAYKLHLSGDADTRIQIDATTTQGIYFTKAGANNGTYRVDTNGNFEWYTKTVSQAMTLTAGGNLLVGTTSGSVAGRVVVQGSSAAIEAIGVWNAATSGDNLFLTFNTDGAGTQRGSIDYNRAANQVRYNITSDLNLKTNIRDLNNAGALIDRLRPRIFDWKESGHNIDNTGFVAQEVFEVFPDAVSKGSDTFTESEGYKQWAMDASKFMPLVVAELQSLRARVAALEAK